MEDQGQIDALVAAACNGTISEVGLFETYLPVDPISYFGRVMNALTVIVFGSNFRAKFPLHALTRAPTHRLYRVTTSSPQPFD